MLGSEINRNKKARRAEWAAIATGCLIAFGLATTQAFAANEPWEENFTMNTPFGFKPGEENRAFDPSTRDTNGNRVMVQGYSQFSNTAGVAGEGSGVGNGGVFGSALAVGNQLNVITNGNNNTVIVDATQINNGDQEAVILNGTLNLD